MQPAGKSVVIARKQFQPFGFIAGVAYMAGASNESRRKAAIQRALVLVSEALDLVDGHGGPPEAAANLGLALQILRETQRSKSR